MPSLRGETSPLLEVVKVADPEVSLCMCQILILHGADPDLQVDGQIPLHEAVRRQRSDVVTLLLKAGASTHLKNGNVCY